MTKCINFAVGNYQKDRKTDIKQTKSWFLDKRKGKIVIHGSMTQTKRIRFTKMHGCGNNYIYVYLPDNPIDDLRGAAIEWSRQGFGIGSDGLITIDRSEVADFRMRIFNADGSEAMMCGNGVRCCGKYVRDHHLTEKKTVTFETLAGIKTLWLEEDVDGTVMGARVDMGEPVSCSERFVISDGREFRGVPVSMGNPHFVIFLDEGEDIEKFDVARYGSRLEHHEAFPDGCNIEFAKIREDGVIRMRVWERGSGITMACGTGACATSVAATLTQETTHTNTIQMDGGLLKIEWSKADGHVYMTGPAERVFEGVIEIHNS